MNDERFRLSRRQFLSKGTCGLMGIGSLVNTMSQLQLMNSAVASTLGPVSSDYKALVCIFLRGGCDMNNVLIPVGENPQAATYASDRGAVAIPNGVETSFNPDGEDVTHHLSGTPAPFGLHPSLTNLANIYNAGEAGFITNVGTLAEHTTRDTYNSSSLPRQLFSHSDQVTEWMSSIADAPYTSGWGARVADLYHDTWNTLSNSSMLISASGNNQFLNGSTDVPQYTVTTTGAVSLSGFGTDYSNALNPDGTYRDTSQGHRLKGLERIMAYSHSNLIGEAYTSIVKRARETEAVITAATQSATDIGLDLDAIFSTYGAAGTNIGDELLSIARLIAGRSQLGNNRQIFFVDLGGFDNHQDINEDLTLLLSELDAALGAFHASMQALATLDADFDSNMVTTFQASDFNRTWTPNGEDPTSAGTDHAWGSHAFVMGGAVQGGNLYGTLPELAVGGISDVPSGTRGRWIPTTSVDQYAAVLAHWFGVPLNSSEMQTIFPNLDRFDDPFTGTANLAFL